MKKIILILICLMLCGAISSSAWGAACGSGPFYISSSLGSDSNNGTSTATPWAHHPWDTNKTANAACTLAGDNVVYMRGGDVWYAANFTTGQAGSDAHPITTSNLGGFGSTTLPLISAGALLNGAWTLDSGTIYHIALATQTYMVYNGSTKLTWDNNTSPSSGKWFWASNTLYVNIGGDPTGGNIIASQNNYAININQDYQIFNGIDAQMSNYNTAGSNFFVNAKRHIKLINCTASKSLQNGVYVYSAANAGDTTFENLLLDGLTIDATDMICGLQLNSVDTGTVRNCTISGNSYASRGIYINTASYNLRLYDNVISGFSKAATGEGIYIFNGPTLNRIYANTLSGNHFAVYINNANVNYLYSNSIVDNGSGVYSSTSTGAGVVLAGSSSGNEIYLNDLERNIRGVTHTAATGTGNNKVMFNKVIDSKVNGIDCQASIAAPGSPFEVYNNVIIHHPALDDWSKHTGHGLDAQMVGKNVEFYNNSIYSYCALADTNCQAIAIADSYATIKLNNNLYYSIVDGAAIGKLGDTEYDSLSTWQAALTEDAEITIKDTNSISADPLFTDAANGDFSTLPGAPGRGTGVRILGVHDAGMTIGINQILIPENWIGNVDIGAYQSTPLVMWSTIVH